MGFLDGMAERKRAEVEEKKRRRPAEQLEGDASTPVRDFHAAISAPGSVIAELKARTPTVDRFEQSGVLDRLAPIYARNGAAAISVVTDEANFGTSLDTVRMVRGQVALPVIAKDFVVDPYQILEARAYGADAILLIARLLDAPELARLLGVARRLGMHALVETHDEGEVAAALEAGARIVGVNNRDLDGMRVSLDTTRRLAPLVPPDVVLVAESGIRTRADIEDLTRCGARAFLVGGALLAARDAGAELRALTTPSPVRD